MYDDSSYPPTGPVRGHYRLCDLERVSHGAYRPRASGDEDARAADLGVWSLLLPDEAAFTHITGAWMRGWRLPELWGDVPVFASVPLDATCPRRPGLVCSRLVDYRPPPATVPGVRPADTGAQILMRAARDLSVLDLLVMADSGLARKEIDVREMDELLGGSRPGVRMLREVWALADARSESAWESILRAFHLVMGVAVEPQVEIFDDQGRVVARADLLVKGTRRVQEYDGAVHRDRSQHRRDLQRSRALLAVGYERRGYSKPDLVNHPAVTMDELDGMLGRPRDVRRLRAWSRLLHDSTLSPSGRARLHNRWRRVGPPAHWSQTA